MMIKKRKVEIIAFTVERPVGIGKGSVPFCPYCQRESHWLTTAQAAMLAQVGTASIRRWLALGKAHGLRTVGGQHRICRESLFINLNSPHQKSMWQEVRNEVKPEAAK